MGTELLRRPATAIVWSELEIEYLYILKTAEAF